MKNLYYTLCFAILSTVTFAQQAETLNFQDFYNNENPQRSYDEFVLKVSSDTLMQQMKGWKHIARWADYAARHLGKDGKPISNAEYTQSLSEYKEMQKTFASGLRANPWSPAGPSAAPDPISDFLFTGTGRINTISFHPTDPQVMWIGGGQGGLWKSTNGGSSWFPIGDDLPVLRVSDIAVNPNNPEEMYICVGDYAYLAYWIETRDVKRNTHFGLGVYRSIDGGTTWAPTGLTTEFSDKDASLMRRTFISSEDDNILVAAGIKGVFRSEDRGETWTTILEQEIWDIEQDPNSPNTLYASTGFIANLQIGRAAAWKSTDFGKTWNKLNTEIPEEFAAQRLEIAISPVNSDYVYIAACDLNGGLYGFYRSTDAGQTWELRSFERNILHWSEGSSSGGQGTYDLALMADPTDVDKVYVGGVNQWVTQDGGSTWNGVSYWTGRYGPAVHADHHYLAHNPHDSKIYLCHDGGVSRTAEVIPGSWDSAYIEDDYEWPTQWEHLNEGLANMAFYRLGISQTSSRNIYAGAQDMGTFHRQNETWSYNSLGDGMECIISPVSDDILYGSSQYGNLFRSYDGGFSFFGFGESPWRQESSEWTTPYMLGHTNPDLIYVGGSNVWTSVDAGETFNQTSDFSAYPISAMAVAPTEPSRIYVGKRVWYGADQPGQIFRLENDQITWTEITDGTPCDSIYISYLTVDDEDKNLLWATFAGFAEGAKVYESRNGGDTWKNISYNLPNVPANCVIQHAGADHNPLYVGMDRGVYYKNDTMAEWQLYAEGLPNVIVSELEIHRDDQMLYIATFGRGVWVNNLLDQISTSTSSVTFDETRMTIAPNPSRGPVEVVVDAISAGEYLLDVVNSTGQVVHSQKLVMSSGSNTTTINNLSVSGLYYVRLHNGKTMHVEKLVKVD